MNPSSGTNESVLSSPFKKTKFSRNQLIVFAVIFAAIGGYILWRTFAAAPLVASVEAEQMILPSGASVYTDSSASAGKAIKMSSNGTLSGSVNFPSAVNAVTVMAKGTQCQGAPVMSVTLDSTKLLSGTAVSATSWTAYTATPASQIASGSHTLSIAFSNDYAKTKGNSGKVQCSRDLYVDVTNFYGPIVTTPAPTVSLSASPVSVSAGQSSTLTWASTNTTSCSASGSWNGSQSTSGSFATGALNQTSTYTLSCTGGGGTTSTSTTVLVTAATGFTTSLTQGMTITPPYTWTFNPGVSSVKGYFWADGVLLGTAAPDSSGKYTFTIQSSTLTAGAHTLGHAWDLADGTHQVGPAGYSVTIAGSTVSSGGPGTGYSGPWRNATYTMPSSFTKTITTASAFKSLVSSSGTLVAGDVVHVVGPMTLDGCAGCHTVINKRLSAPASIYFDSNVVFAGDSNTSVGFNSVYVDASNINLYGGQIAGGMANSGLHLGPAFTNDTQGTSNIRWWGLKIHDIGGTGVLAGGLQNSSGAWLGSSGLDIDVETWNVGLNYNDDPHTVKGTGLHAIYIGSTSSDPPGTVMVNNSKFSVYSHDTSKCAGDAQVGQSTQNTEFWIRAANLSFTNSAGGWTAARAFTPWTGASSPYTDANITVHDVEAHNVSGPVVFTGSLGSGPVTVEYGRGVGVLTWSTASSYFGGNPYQPNSHVTYQNVQ